MVHGHLFAVYKCDSCCAAAVWCCDGHHFCDRCHDDPCSDKHYPCPGPGLCPLGIPHARNTAGNMNRAKEGPSFVIGCTACLGHVDENGEQEDLGGPEGYDFGYPARDWAAFASGEEVVAALGDEEIRARMRAHRPPLRHEGDLAECAERLLLREQGVRSAEALLEAAGGGAAGGAVLRRRLATVGLSCGGQPLECAQRLLFLLQDEPLESLRLWDAREALRPPRGARRQRRRRRQGEAKPHLVPEVSTEAPVPLPRARPDLRPAARAAVVAAVGLILALLWQQFSS